MKANILVSLFFVSSVTWGAASNQSLNYFQPLAGKSSVLGQITLAKIKSKYTGDSTTNSSQIYSTKYLYGWSDSQSAGIDLTYEKSKLEGSYTSETKGLDDLEFNYLGNYDLSAATLRYGADLSFSLANQKESTPTQVGTPNSGGISLTPYIGFELPISDMRAGISLSRSISGDRSTDNEDGSTTKESGGESTNLSLYGEYNFGGGAVGGGYTLLSTDKTKSKTNGLTDENQGARTRTWQLQGSLDLAPEQTLLLGFALAKVGTYKVNGNEVEISGSAFIAGYRVQF